MQGFENASSFTNKNIKTNISDIEYCAPEILNGGVGDAKVDIWALGAVTYAIIESLSPFYCETEDIIKENILKKEVIFHGEAWDDVSDECKDFIR